MMTASDPIPACLITGGSSGIGLATASRFATQGFRIAICGRNPDRLELAEAAIQSTNADTDVLIIRADLEDPLQAISVAEQTYEQFDRIDVLVNNAAAAPLAKFEEISAEAFESSTNLNIRSPFYLTQFVWKRWKSRTDLDTGRVVVNISSLAAVDPFPGFSLYGASKAWLDLLTVSLASEGEGFGVRVCSIRPGAVETPMLRGLFPDFPAEQCVSPELIADYVWKCVDEPENFPSGDAFPVTGQS